ncbi:hypothetical protein AAEO56_07090 [Flavobacterium sp. DGU11]|uniref:Uncharacterized protein n=1 Tax=Flavobacterium arundinis TaxID=3139143 RepID=A0ABU9HV37_9FLAO
MALLIALLFLLKPVFPIVDYAANYSYIAKELCENRSKPQLHCNGKCHLMKELAKAAEHEKPLSEKKQSKVEHDFMAYFQQSTPVTQLCLVTIDEKKRFTHRKSLYSTITLFYLLRPPACS